MATEIKLPALKENVEVVEINAIKVAVGDVIAKDQALLEVQADKAALETDREFWRIAQVVGDGLGDGRVLVRPSGTEPVVRVMVEADTEAAAEQAAVRLATAVEIACGSPRP